MKDYGKVRSIKEFFAWRAELSQDVACGIDNYMDYLARKSPTDKLLSEEIFPIAYYLRYKKHDDKLNIELNPSHEKWDAKILDINGNLVEILEVTYLPRETSHIDRLIIAGKWKEKSSRDAFTFDDYIRQFNESIDINGYIEKVINKIESKKKNNYQPNTTLIVSLADEMVMESEERFEKIINSIIRKINDPSPFNGIYFTDHTNNLHYEMS